MRGAVGQNLDGLQNFAYALGRGTRVELPDVVKDREKVIQDFRGQFDARHAPAHAVRLRAAGLRAGSLRARAARWAFASSQGTARPVD